MEIRHARSATRHRISRQRSRHIVERTGVIFAEPAPQRAVLADPRLVFLGADDQGELLEVMAIQTDDGGLLIIHAQRIRPRYIELLSEGLK